jgi:hypothetical protein
VDRVGVGEAPHACDNRGRRRRPVGNSRGPHRLVFSIRRSCRQASLSDARQGLIAALMPLAFCFVALYPIRCDHCNAFSDAGLPWPCGSEESNFMLYYIGGGVGSVLLLGCCLIMISSGSGKKRRARRERVNTEQSLFDGVLHTSTSTANILTRSKFARQY